MTRCLISKTSKPRVSAPPFDFLREVTDVARVLIVDDEESDRLLQRTILERAGHEIFVAADGEEALREYEDNRIDVVVADLQMPRVHGFELIAALARAMAPSDPGT